MPPRKSKPSLTEVAPWTKTAARSANKTMAMIARDLPGRAAVLGVRDCALVDMGRKSRHRKPACRKEK